MLAFSIEASGVKDFMSKFLKEDTFDDFSARTIEVFTIAKFEINGVVNKECCTWGQLRPYVFNIIKGSVKPTYIKAVFSYKEELLEEIHQNAKALFLNMSFENNEVKFFTGTSQKVFTMEKDMEQAWDEYIKGFLKKSGISVLYHGI